MSQENEWGIWGWVAWLAGVLLYPIEFYMSRILACIWGMKKSIASFEGNFTSPQSCFVEVTEAVNDNGNRQGDTENSKQSSDSTNTFAKTWERRGGAYWRQKKSDIRHRVNFFPPDCKKVSLRATNHIIIVQIVLLHVKSWYIYLIFCLLAELDNNSAFHSLAVSKRMHHS